MSMTKRQMLEFQAAQKRRQKQKKNQQVIKQNIGTEPPTSRDQQYWKDRRSQVTYSPAQSASMENPDPEVLRGKGSPASYAPPKNVAEASLPGIRRDVIPAAEDTKPTIGTMDDPLTARRTPSWGERVVNYFSPNQSMANAEKMRNRDLGIDAPSMFTQIPNNSIGYKARRIGKDIGESFVDVAPGIERPGTLSIGDLKNMQGVGGTSPAAGTQSVTGRAPPPDVLDRLGFSAPETGKPVAEPPNQGSTIETINIDLNEGRPTTYASQNDKPVNPAEGAAARAASGSGQAVTGTQTVNGNTYQVLEDGSMYLDDTGVTPIESSGIQSFGGVARTGGIGDLMRRPTTVSGRGSTQARDRDNPFTISRGVTVGQMNDYLAARRGFGGGAGGGTNRNIMRQINRIHDRADNAYEDAINQGKTVSAAQAAADVIRSRADSLVGADSVGAAYDRNMASRESTAAMDRYRQDMVMQGYSKQEAEQLAAAKERTDEMFTRMGKMFMKSDEDDPAIADKSAAEAEFGARQFAPTNIEFLPPAQQERAAMQSYQMWNAAQYLGNMTNDRFDSREDLLNMRISNRTGKPVYDKIKTKEPRLRELIPGLGSDMGPLQYIMGDLDIISPRTGGRTSLQNFLDETNLSATEFFNMFENYE